MYTRADATSGTVAVVVTSFVVRSCGKFWGEGCDVLVVIWIEDVGVRVVGLIMVEAPDVDDDNGAFGDEFAVDPII